MNAALRNIELKARCADLARAADAARALGAADAGELRQLDTYFVVPSGRLKLRETDGKPAELIWYRRADDVAFRGSDYYVLPIPQPIETKVALISALGCRGEVRKRRQLLLWHNVRIHLDDVTGLGTFLEFEAVIGDDADEVVSMERLARLREALDVRDEARVAVSYSDLLGL
ncbi:MAG: class IV adenylate cyclase [Tepidisphaeraceae bacterium]